MLTLTMTKGLPASGKSTWAKMQVAKSGGRIKRINKDDLRDMIDNGKWSRNNETEVLKVRDKLIVHYLSRGYDVIVDDTNLHPKHYDRLVELAQGNHATLEVKDFLDVPLKTCIERDLTRPNSVGERVIRSMFNQFLKPKVDSPVKPDWSKPMAIICDIDGTAAHMVDRGPYDWGKVGQDEPDDAVRDILQCYTSERSSESSYKQTTVIMLSGRDSVCREQTEKWLKDNGFPYDYLYMRAEHDARDDTVIKRELFDQHIRDRYNVLFVLDDRNKVVEMWRDLGLKVLQVAEGDF